MKKVDVLIVYEHKARELETCALLSAELQRRGYTTEVSYNYAFPKRYKTEAKVVVVPHVYNDWHLEFYTRNAKQTNRCVISMQWEQVLNENSEDGIHNPTGQAMHVQHIAWGQAQVDRYLRNSIEESHIHETGCIPMDLLRPEFGEYFLSKEQIGKELSLDASKEWVLFISSFSYANRTNESIEDYAKKYGASIKEFAKISKDSYKVVVKWLTDAAKSNPDKIFIYRKHPAENLSKELKDLEERIPNFRCIDDYSMRQWTLVADRIYNWFSTSMADVYFAHKSCYILRPFPIPRSMDVSIMVDAEYLTTYESFLASLRSKGYYFPVDENKIKYFYSNGKSGKMAYEKVADLCERMINNPQMGYDYHFPNRYGLKTMIKMLYDNALYLYGRDHRTSDKMISLLFMSKMFANIGAKLRMFNQELYGADLLCQSYIEKFSHVLSNK